MASSEASCRSLLTTSPEPASTYISAFETPRGYRPLPIPAARIITAFRKRPAISSADCSDTQRPLSRWDVPQSTHIKGSGRESSRPPTQPLGSERSEERREGKSVDLG